MSNLSNLLHHIIIPSLFLILLFSSASFHSYAIESDNDRYYDNENNPHNTKEKESSARLQHQESQEQKKQRQDQHEQQKLFKKEVLTPSDLPSPRLFMNWDPPSNITLSLPNRNNLIAAKGSILQQQPRSSHLTEKSNTTSKNANNLLRSHFHVLQEAIPRESVSEILSLLRGSSDYQNDGRTAVPLDTEPDSVDGMSSQEIFLDNDGLRSGQSSKGFAWLDTDDMDIKMRVERSELRQKLKKLMDPILEDVITPFVLGAYKDQCAMLEGRYCTPCYSLIRRYRKGERISHAPHHDKHSLVTVVVSLSDYGEEYHGGLYVSTENSERYYIGLKRGDAVVHQGDLYHGVNVLDNENHVSGKDFVAERWSWILWYRDSNKCEDHAQDWFKSCAKDGNPTCQYLHATSAESKEDVLYWNKKAAENGHGAACVKLARAYLKKLPSNLPFDPIKAKYYFERAVEGSNEPDGHYGLATLILQFLTVTRDEGSTLKSNDPLLVQAISHLESAAIGGHVYAMFNLGIVHLYGYGYSDGIRNPSLAGEWFEQSGLPEGFAARALHLRSLGRQEEAHDFQRRAEVLGYGSSWRKIARERTGSGGASGVSLNLPWPPLSGGLRPQEW